MRARTLLCSLLTLLLPALLALGWAGGDDGASSVAGVPANAKETEVVRVTDGDTIVLQGLGASRAIGIDAPEVRGAPECFGREATAFAARALPPGTPVSYRRGIEPVDRYGRDLVYLWLEDGRLFNALLVERGYATARTIPPNDDYEERFTRLARTAREHGRGLWSPRRCGEQ